MINLTIYLFSNTCFGRFGQTRKPFGKCRVYAAVPLVFSGQWMLQPTENGFLGTCGFVFMDYSAASAWLLSMSNVSTNLTLLVPVHCFIYPFIYSY